MWGECFSCWRGLIGFFVGWWCVLGISSWLSSHPPLDRWFLPYVGGGSVFLSFSVISKVLFWFEPKSIGHFRLPCGLVMAKTLETNGRWMRWKWEGLIEQSSCSSWEMRVLFLATLCWALEGSSLCVRDMGLTQMSLVSCSFDFLFLFFCCLLSAVIKQSCSW